MCSFQFPSPQKKNRKNLNQELVLCHQFMTRYWINIKKYFTSKIFHLLTFTKRQNRKHFFWSAFEIKVTWPNTDKLVYILLCTQFHWLLFSVAQRKEKQRNKTFTPQKIKQLANKPMILICWAYLFNGIPHRLGNGVPNWTKPIAVNLDFVILFVRKTRGPITFRII